MKDFLLGSLKSKTQWTNSLAILVGVLLENTDIITAIFGAVSTGKAVALLGAANLVLRAFTTQSLPAKVSDAS